MQPAFAFRSIHVVAEGAGAASVAAALKHPIEGAKTIACVVSGGNIDLDVLATILRGETPRRRPTEG
jgi:threonine dehydratase